MKNTKTIDDPHFELDIEMDNGKPIFYFTPKHGDVTTANVTPLIKRVCTKEQITNLIKEANGNS